MQFPSVQSLAFAYGGPGAQGQFKLQTDDFIVEEFLPFQPEGQGEHSFLYIEKCHENTEYVARVLARHAGVRQRDIGFAGLKDRHGRTRQWFSVWLPGKPDPDWQALNSEQLQILSVTRHPRKLKRGVLAGNRFQIRIRHWQGDVDQTHQQLKLIAQQGYPNYFGEQRFGFQGRNLEKALAMFAGQKVKPELRSIYLSAVRSFLFNQILSARVESANWNRGLAGEVFQLADSHSFFNTTAMDEQLAQRVDSFDIHPTAALWGQGESAATASAFTTEQAIIANYPELAAGLLKAGLEQDRRALRVMPVNLSWEFEAADSLLLAFQLPAGSYATALLREIVTLGD